MFRKLTPLGALLTLCLLTGCATNTVATVDDGCRSFKPISSSKQDTEPTRRQVIAHNRAFDAVCPTPAAQKVAANG